MEHQRGFWRHNGGPSPYLPAVAQCRPDAWGRVSFFGTPLLLTGIDDANQPLSPGVDVEVMDLHGLLMAPPMPIDSLDQIKMQSE